MPVIELQPHLSNKLLAFNPAFRQVQLYLIRKHSNLHQEEDK